MSRRYKRYRSRKRSSNNEPAGLVFLLALFFFTYRNIIATLFLILILAVVAALVIHNHLYKKTAYYKVTGRSYFSVRRDLGLYGEYLTYKHLQHLEAQGARFLFNVYIPKENGETSEIDVLMICPKGLVVFESKNYSGWIFGSESQANWYQTLPSGRKKSHKENFYNPVMQNRGHIKHLSAFLGEQIPMHSVIVFSDRCTLKKVQMTSNDIPVINRSDVASAVSATFARIPQTVLGEDRIAEIYDLLYPFTQVDAAAKAQHIANINSHVNKTPEQTPEPPATPAVPQENEAPAALPDTDGVMDAPAVDVIVSPAEEIEETPISPTPPVLKCPRCNSDLILRTASRGANAGNQFYGCSNYPKCRYIQNITTSDSETDT